jgi:hypothetical protein
MAPRQNRIRVKTLVALIVILLALGGMGAFMRPGIEPDRVLASRFGDVKWNHEQHARMQEIASCQVCHHQEAPGVTRSRPCKTCHKPVSNADAVVLAAWFRKEYLAPAPADAKAPPPPMTAFHGRCIGCHSAMKQGPVVCRDCHAQSFHGPRSVTRWDHRAHARYLDMGAGPGRFDACFRCHHQDKHAKSEADFRPCGACHKPALTMGLDRKTGQAFHENLRHEDCADCHVETHPAEGLRTCKECHTRWAVDTKKQRPPIEQSIHAACMACHNTENPELTGQMPARCDDCHEPDQSVVADVGVGILMWDHDRHAKYGDEILCDTCHHTDDPDSPHMACRRCHGAGVFENPSLADALRKRCTGCHQKKGNGLVSWEHLVLDPKVVRMFKVEAPEGVFHWDHREHAVSWSFSCRSCHHPMLREGGSSVTATRLNLQWDASATHPTSCRTCHGPEGAVAGSPAGGTQAPAFLDVLKKACVGCHEKLGGGPAQWDDFFRVEPLEPPRSDEEKT